MIRAAALIAMALADLAANWAISLAICLATTAVAAPLLVMLGLQAGILGQVFGALNADPGVRAVTLDATGSARLDDSWFTATRTWPQVGFVHPATRFAAAQVDLIVPGQPEQRASLLPTAPGDPVFPGAAALVPGQVRLSADLATRLGATPGTALQIAFSRTRDGRVEPMLLPLTVASIADPAAYRGRAAFVDFALTLAIEDYRDGFGAPLIGAPGPQAPPRQGYPGFRLYARDLAAVAPLVARLTAEGLSVTAQTDRIATAQSLAANLGAITSALSLLGALGLGGGIAAIQWSLAMQKRRTLATLGLIGFGAPWLIGFPAAQAVILGALGALGTSTAATLFCGWINGNLASAGGACVLAPTLHLGMAATVMALSLIPAILIGWHLSRMEIALALRDT